MKVVLVVASFLLALPVWASDAVKIEGWARASAGKARNGVVYLTIYNHTGVINHLLSVQTKIANRAAIHNHIMENGIMRMRQVKSVSIAKNSTLVMKPGGFHVMLIGLKRPLIEGEKFSLNLNFSDSGYAMVSVIVMSVGAQSRHSEHKH